MYYSNGFVCGGEPKEAIRIENIKALPDRILLVDFNNGERRLFDAKKLEGEVYEKLNDDGVLEKCSIEHGVPTWCNGEIDCAPEFIYHNSYEYESEYQYEATKDFLAGEDLNN